MKKKFVFIAALLSLISVVSITTYVVSSSKTVDYMSAEIAECTVHEGYHYAYKAPTIDSPGHREFWACCKCQHQYLEKPAGTFIDQDDEYMIGVIDELHIAYLPPLTEGGENGDYWTNDPFDE